MNRPRVIFLSILLICVAGYFAIQRDMLDAIPNPFDTRPVREILFIGNSQTFTHNVPAMVRKIANSTDTPQRYRMTVHAVPGQAFEGHWNDASLQEKLRRPWDTVIVQGRSGESAYATNHQDIANFHDYGGKLLAQAKQVSKHTAVYVVWNENAAGYGTAWDFVNASGGVLPMSDTEKKAKLGAMYGSVQGNHRKLALAHQARLMNVGYAWQVAAQSCPNIKLYGPDEHHASVEGAYLAALVIFRGLSDMPINEHVYRPAEVDAQEASCLATITQWIQ